MTPATATETDLTVSEKILLAAADLDGQGKNRFTAEDLAVAVWQRWPATFGLKGYEKKHPDCNKSNSSIMGERGLARRGWLVKIGSKLYQITMEGRRVAKRLLGEESKEPENLEYLPINGHREKFLMALLGSTAYRKFEDNQKNELAFADACRYWGIYQTAANLQGEAVDERLNFTERMLNELEQELAREDGRLSSGRLITGGDIRVLRNIHRYMEDRFDRLLNLLRNRK